MGFVGKCCSSLALHLGVGESNSNASSIFQALHLLGRLPTSAGPRRWLHNPVTLINNCFPTWRAGLQSDRRVISLGAAAVPACRAPVGSGCAGTPPPMSTSGTAMAACVTQSLLLHLPLKRPGSGGRGEEKGIRRVQGYS